MVSRDTFKEQLYQVLVDDREGKTFPAGPRIGHEGASRILAAVEARCIRSRDWGWKNPRLVPVIAA
jgi:hypothetical protein